MTKVVPAPEPLFKKTNLAKPDGNGTRPERNATALCLCRALKPTIVLLRTMGLFPIVAEHDSEGRCSFGLSKKFLVYSLVVYGMTIARFLFATEVADIFNIHKGKSLHAILSALSDILYGLFTVVLNAINLLRYPRFAKTFNRMVSMRDEGLLCQSCLRGILKVQYVALSVFFVVLTFQFVLVVSLNWSEAYLTDFFDYKLYSNKLTHNLFFFLYVIFINMSSVVVGMFGCFQKTAGACLGFEPAHVLKDVDFSSNHAEFLAVYKYEICEERHDVPTGAKLLSASEALEFLRRLHEEVSLVSYEMNECLDPQFLLHVVVELSALIIHWYAVILYVAYRFTSETTRTVNVLNVFFVAAHTLGVLTFLKHAQQLQNIVGNLTDFLLEYSTRITLPEEHQQLRIFIHKLKVHRPLTASGVFNIDLGIAGPVFANILTYVLVALQFDVPKN